jgi:hypothetical protein
MRYIRGLTAATVVVLLESDMCQLGLGPPVLAPFWQGFVSGFLRLLTRSLAKWLKTAHCKEPELFLYRGAGTKKKYLLLAHLRKPSTNY